VVVERGVEAEMRDGIVLVADVYRPDGANPAPVLVHRTAYGRQTEGMVSGLVADPVLLAAAGYAVVVQDVRGRFASGGDWVPFVHEMADGYDTVEWAAARSWSDGRVGCYGSSYMGITTHLAVAAKPPSLVAAAVIVASRDPDDGLIRTGGAFELGFLHRWAVNNAGDTVDRLALASDEAGRIRDRLEAVGGDRSRTVRSLPVRDAEGLDVAAPYWRTWIDHPPGDGYWRRTWGLPAEVDVPLLSIVGLRDWMQPSMLALHRRIQGDGVHELVVGPWSHLSAYGGPTGVRDYQEVAPGGPGTFGPILLDWFDRRLRARPGAGTDSRPVRYFVTGEDRWETAGQWPPPATEMSLHLAGPDRLVVDGDVAAGERRYRYDPADPTPTAGGMICQPDIGPDGVVDQRVVEARADVLGYTSLPLESPVGVVGAAVAELWWTSSAEDTDVMVKLVDVEPDGFAANVTEGVLRVRYRLGGTDDWLVPGEPTRLRVRLADAAHTWLPGHRIRLDVASANFPRLSRNLNTRVLPEAGTLADAVVAEHRIAHGGRHPSCLVLPVVETGPGH
jgi:putative CocE/NonD family hydrolase